MPQKGLKKVMGFGEAERTFLQSFSRFPKNQILLNIESGSVTAALALLHNAAIPAETLFHFPGCR